MAPEETFTQLSSGIRIQFESGFGSIPITAPPPPPQKKIPQEILISGGIFSGGGGAQCCGSGLKFRPSQGR